MLYGLCALIVLHKLESHSKLSQKADELPSSHDVVLHILVALLHCSLLDVQKMGTDLFGGRGVLVAIVALYITLETILRDEILIDIIRGANTERLDYRISNHILLVEEAGVAQVVLLAVVGVQHS